MDQVMIRAKINDTSRKKWLRAWRWLPMFWKVGPQVSFEGETSNGTLVALRLFGKVSRGRWFRREHLHPLIVSLGSSTHIPLVIHFLVRWWRKSKIAKTINERVHARLSTCPGNHGLCNVHYLHNSIWAGNWELIVDCIYKSVIGMLSVKSTSHWLLYAEDGSISQKHECSLHVSGSTETGADRQPRPLQPRTGCSWLECRHSGQRPSGWNNGRYLRFEFPVPFASWLFQSVDWSLQSTCTTCTVFESDWLLHEDFLLEVSKQVSSFNIHLTHFEFLAGCYTKHSSNRF